MAQEHQVPALDLLPRLREAARQDRRLYYLTDIHWNAEGHQVGAQAVAEFLEQAGLLRQTGKAATARDHLVSEVESGD